MSAKNFLFSNLKKILPSSLIGFFKKKKYSNPLDDYFNVLINNVACIDIGASYFEHIRWKLFLDSPGTLWIAVEPNAQNLKYQKSWFWKSQLEVITKGVSDDGKLRDIHVTKVESGSSLLKPNYNNSNILRFQSLKNTHFPYEIKKFETVKLSEIIKKNFNKDIFIKLDIQGSELSILREIKEYILNNKILGVEVEASFLTSTLYENSCKFYEILQFFDQLNYDLIYIEVINFEKYEEHSIKSRRIPNEANAVFIPKLDKIMQMENSKKIHLISFLSCYGLFEDIKIILENDKNLVSQIKNQINYKNFYNKLKTLV
jgi:FkbM family methyltransferase